MNCRTFKRFKILHENETFVFFLNLTDRVKMTRKIGKWGQNSLLNLISSIAVYVKNLIAS